MKKRKVTTKHIGATRIVTNPPFDTDHETLIPGDIYHALWLAVYEVFQAGIAIGRARATASGKRKVK